MENVNSEAKAMMIEAKAEEAIREKLATLSIRDSNTNGREYALRILFDIGWPNTNIRTHFAHCKDELPCDLSVMELAWVCQEFVRSWADGDAINDDDVQQAKWAATELTSKANKLVETVQVIASFLPLLSKQKAGTES